MSLMENTDVKIINFWFLLVISYSLCGLRMALIQLCIWGLYIVIGALVITFVLNINNLSLGMFKRVFI